jgi:gliding motility-associated-like protein
MKSIRNYILFLLTLTPYLLSAQIIVPAEGSVMENFDNNNPWTFGGALSSWLHDNPNKIEVTDDITGGGKCLILGGNGIVSYVNDNEDSWAESPEYDLSAVDNPYLEFWFYHSNEAGNNFDEIWMEYSLDNGISWSILAPAVGQNNCYDQNWYNYLDNWGGASPTANCCSSSGACTNGGGIGPTGWILVRKCVESFIANQPSVKFRFRSDNGSFCNYYGATIDNFTVADANLEADFSITGTGLPFGVAFTDESRRCPDSWQWDFGDGTTSTNQNPTHTYAAAGVYTVQLIANASTAMTAGCGGPFTDTLSYQIEILDVQTINLQNPTCFGYYDGFVNVNVTGSLGGETYTWAPAPAIGNGTANIAALNAGVYNLTVTPAGMGLPAVYSVTLTEPAGMSLSTSSTDPSTCVSADGSVNLTVAGGASPYNYQWSNNATSQNISNLAAGSYTVTVTDANSCSLTEGPISVEATTDLVVQLDSIVDISCNGGSDGIIYVSVDSGTAPYTYQWSNGSSTEDPSGLAAGSYELTLTDADACVVTLEAVTLTEPTPISISVISNNASCARPDGSLDITTSGGTAPYFYQWDHGAITEDLDSVVTGDYQLTISDANGCSFLDGPFRVGIDTTIAIDLTLSNRFCVDQVNTYTTEPLVIGSIPPYDYIWSTGDTTAMITYTNSGNYYATITDAVGCSLTYFIGFTEASPPNVSAYIQPNMVDTIYLGEEIILNAGGSVQNDPWISYRWLANPSDVIFSDANQPITTASAWTAGENSFSVIATDGCEADTSSIAVYVIELGVPALATAFTPNGDGVNESFYLIGMPTEFLTEFKVFNRWGNLIYDDAEEANWDGSYNGAEQPRGDYIYRISYQRPQDAEATVLRGRVTILR